MGGGGDGVGGETVGKRDQKIAKQALEVQKASARYAKYALALVGVMALIALIALFKPQTVSVTIDLRSVLDSIPVSVDSVQLSDVPVDFDTVKTVVRDSLDKGERIDTRDLMRIGNVLYVQGKLREAESYYRVALHQGQQSSDSFLTAGALGNIGLIYFDKGDLDEALKYHKDALEIHREVGYRQGEANQLGNIGLIYSDNGDLDVALKYLQEALGILDEHGLAHGRDIIENAIAEIEAEQNKGDSSP